MTRPDAQTATLTAGGAILARLKALGIDRVFANSGTDFPPIIEGLAEAMACGMVLPTAIIAPHEHAAMGMAHGAYLASGRTQAVMLHTNVGLANAAIGAINAACDNVPIIIMSGRTPVTEKGRLGSRFAPIAWGQEMRDQAALVREACKWDYELRFPEQVCDVLDRAFAIANSTPKGPVYLSLPLEVLCEPFPGAAPDAPSSMAPAIIGPRSDDISRAAAILAGARNPVIFAQHGAGSATGFVSLSRLAGDWAIPVNQYWAVALALPSDHDMNVGVDPAPWVEEADAILVIDSLAPWLPDRHQPRADASVIHLGPNPLQSRTPVRNFRSDISIACETADGIAALANAMQPMIGDAGGAIAARRASIARFRQQAEEASAGQPGTLTKADVGRSLSAALSGTHATILSELGVPLTSLDLKHHDSWRQEPQSGGLGWSLPCAIGIQLADPDRLVVATMGDGSYIFANPAACNQIIEACALPILTIIVNNAGYGAVRHAVKGLYPDGFASRANQMPLIGLEPVPDFQRIAEASRIWARRVDDPGKLDAAMNEAMSRVRDERLPALLDIAITG